MHVSSEVRLVIKLVGGCVIAIVCGGVIAIVVLSLVVWRASW